MTREGEVKNMRKKIVSIALILIFSLSILPIQAEETVQSRLEQYICIGERALIAVEEQNSKQEQPNDEITLLLDEARDLLEYAKDSMEEGDNALAAEYTKNALKQIKEAAMLLDTPPEIPKNALNAQLKRLEQSYHKASIVVSSLHEKGFDTSILDKNLQDVQTSLQQASSYIDKGEYIAARNELRQAGASLQNIQEIIRGYTQTNENIQAYLSLVKEKLGMAIKIIELAQAQGLDTQTAEELLESFTTELENAKTMYQEGDIFQSLQHIRISAQIGKELRHELQNLASALNNE